MAKTPKPPKPPKKKLSKPKAPRVREEYVDAPSPEQQAVTSGTALATQKAASVTALRVVDEPSLGAANNLLVVLKQAKDTLEEKRKFFLGPMKESLKRLEQQFKLPAQMLFDADRELRNKVLVYIEAKRSMVEVERAALVSQAEAAAADGDDVRALNMATAAVTLAAPAKTMLTESSRVSTREVDAFEVIDYGAVPHEFFTLDEKKVLAAIRSGQRDIPGIRVFKKAQLAVGGI